MSLCSDCPPNLSKYKRRGDTPQQSSLSLGVLQVGTGPAKQISDEEVKGLMTNPSWPALSPGMAIQTKFVVEGLLLPGVGCVGLVGIVYMFWE